MTTREKVLEDVLRWLDRRGGLGFDAHDRITAALAMPSLAPAPETEAKTVPVAFLVYWLRRSYDAIIREGWEEGASAHETSADLINVLANFGHDTDDAPPPKPQPSHYIAGIDEIESVAMSPPPRESSAGDAAKAATLAERERCAKGCEDFAKGVIAVVDRDPNGRGRGIVAQARIETAEHLARLIRETGADLDALPATTEGA